jgi:GNAT superfamily N-acetyltransferase
MALMVRPATPDRWEDVVTAFGRRGDNPSWCWCQLFLRPATGAALPASATDNRRSLQEEVTRASVPPGLLAYLNEQPVGWTRVGPRSGFPGVQENRALARVLTEDAGVWWVTCFAVDGRRRRAGVGTALLRAAIAFARANGATAVEGHPVDVAALRAAKVGGSAIFTGTKAMFSAAGFTEIGRTSPTRPVMHMPL